MEDTKKKVVQTKKTSMSKKLLEITRDPFLDMDTQENEEVIVKSEDFSKNTKKKKETKSEEIVTDKTYVIPLGGLEEVGKNMTLFQYRDEIVIIDAGLSFPSDEHLGIDIIIPNLSYLESNVDKIKALLITHGHEDHIGAVPYLYQKLGNHIDMYGTKLSMALAESKFDRKDIKKPKIHTVPTRKVIKISKYFTAEFISITHSIAD